MSGKRRPALYKSRVYFDLLCQIHIAGSITSYGLSKILNKAQSTCYEQINYLESGGVLNQEDGKRVSLNPRGLILLSLQKRYFDQLDILEETEAEVAKEYMKLHDDKNKL